MHDSSVMYLKLGGKQWGVWAELNIRLLPHRQPELLNPELHFAFLKKKQLTYIYVCVYILSINKSENLNKLKSRHKRSVKG